METIKNIIFENLQDKLYQRIKKKKPNKKYWLTIIIPVRGRVEFLTPLIVSLKKSICNYNRKVNIIVVEESKTSQHKEICKINNVDYFFIESDTGYRKPNETIITGFSPGERIGIMFDLNCFEDNESIS